MTNRERWLGNDAKLALLVPEYRERFEGVVKRMESAGWRPLVVETRRSLVRQAWLRARGLSRVWKGKHQAGLAMDVISVDHKWEATPLLYMVELAFSAREEGLTTGLVWEMEQGVRALCDMELMRGTRAGLLKLLTIHGRGFDPCHVEVN